MEPRMERWWARGPDGRSHVWSDAGRSNLMWYAWLAAWTNPHTSAIDWQIAHPRMRWIFGITSFNSIESKQIRGSSDFFCMFFQDPFERALLERRMEDSVDFPASSWLQRDHVTTTRFLSSPGQTADPGWEGADGCWSTLARNATFAAQFTHCRAWFLPYVNLLSWSRHSFQELGVSLHTHWKAADDILYGENESTELSGARRPCWACFPAFVLSWLVHARARLILRVSTLVL